MAGVDQLAEAVKSTFGPKGRNVILEKITGTPEVTNDGVTIAREIFLRDPFENMGAQVLKEAAIKTNDMVGDGTTTATVIAQAIVREGMKAITSGGNPVLVKRGIDVAVSALVEHLTSVAHPVTRARLRPRRRDLGQRRREIGARGRATLHTVGDDGVVTVEDSPRYGLSVDFVEDFEFDNGYVSPYLVTDPGRLEAVARRPVHPAVRREDHRRPAADADARQHHAGPEAAGDHRREGRGHRAADAGAQPRERAPSSAPRSRRPASARSACTCWRTWRR